MLLFVTLLLILKTNFATGPVRRRMEGVGRESGGRWRWLVAGEKGGEVEAGLSGACQLLTDGSGDGHQGRADSRRSGLLAGVTGATHHGLDKTLADLDFDVVGNADGEAVVLLVGDLTIDAAGGDDFVAGAQFGEHFLVLLLLLALGGEDEEPHRHEQKDGKEQAERAATGRGGGSSGSGLGDQGREGLGEKLSHFRRCVLVCLKKETARQPCPPL